MAGPWWWHGDGARDASGGRVGMTCDLVWAWGSEVTTEMVDIVG